MWDFFWSSLSPRISKSLSETRHFHPGSPSHCLRHRPPLHHDHCHCLTEIPPRWRNVLLTSTASALGTSTCWNHLGRTRTRRSNCQSHNSPGYLTLDTVPSSREPSAKVCVSLPPLASNNDEHYLQMFPKKIGNFFFKKRCFYPWLSFFYCTVIKSSLNHYPRQSTSTVFVKIVLSSKWTGCFLKGYRQNW